MYILCIFAKQYKFKNLLNKYVLKKFSFSAFFLSIMLLTSCINDEGPGGKSTIEGKVFKVYHLNDAFGFETDTFPAAKEDVFIVYGDEPVYGDKMETGYDGTFQFKYLTPGTYTIYAYSTLPNSQKVAVMDTVTITRSESATAKNIYIHEGKSYNTSYIRGVVEATYFNKGMPITNILPGNDVRVYIKYKDAPYHFDEIRTGLNGEFIFKNIGVGEYEVFVFTEDPYTESLSPVIQLIEVTEPGKVVTFSAPFSITIAV